MLRPQGWQSQTPLLSHEQTARCTASDPKGVSGSRGGRTMVPMGARTQVTQSLRCLSPSAAGAGGLMAQFCPSTGQAVDGLASMHGRRLGTETRVRLTLQTTVPQRRHSPTMSRAQSPDLPL